MKKEINNNKKPVSGFAVLSFLFVAMALAFFSLWFLETEEVSETLAPVSYVIKAPKFKPKEKPGQDLSPLEFLEGESISFDSDKSLLARAEQEGEVKKELKKIVVDQKALNKESDAELKIAQDLVDTEEEGSILKAKAILEDILMKNPKHNESIKELAMIYMYDLNDMNKAQEYMEQSYAISPDTPVFNEVLQLAEQNKNVENFAREVKEKAEKDPENANLASHAAVVLGVQGNYQESADGHARNAQKFGSYKEAQNAAAQYLKLGNQPEAGKQLQQAYELLQADSTVHESEKKIRLKLIEQKIKRLNNSHS